MARKPRLEFEGAAYHVMSRGDHGEAIFSDDRDRLTFLKTLGEACGRTGWVVHTYVLMGNHYHVLLETPQANLVAGMQWLQSTYTQRYNARHQQRGHLFQGRYKAIPVEAGQDGCFARMAMYIHLNPVRAGLMPEGAPMDQYAWSSLPAYTGRERAPEWLRLARVLAAMGRSDTPAGRRAYAGAVEARAQECRTERGRAGLEVEWDAIRRGWYVGSAAFKDSLLDQFDQATEGKAGDSFSGGAVSERGERAALALLKEGLLALQIKSKRLAEMPKGALEKRVLAWLLKKRVVVRNAWIAEHLHMGHPSNIPGFVAAVDKANGGAAQALLDKVAILK
jgi:REP element-mobilizing transposase RayT